MKITLTAALLVPALVLSAMTVAYRSVLAVDTARAPAVSKQAVLDNIARKVLLPGYTELSSRSREFAAAADALTSAPSAASLKRSQEAWKDVLLAWRRTQSFVHGPVADLNVSGRIQFWPSRRQSVDRVLRAPRPIDDTYIQELGANAVGLSALEVMLFDARQDDAARLAAFTGPAGERQRKYYVALARELARQTRLVESAWQGPGGFAARFGSGGQANLNLLVNDMLAAIEVGAQGRLQLVIDKPGELTRSDLIEGGLSGTSQQGMLALVLGAQALFAGGDGMGVDDYLSQLKSPAARRMELQFQKTIESIRAIDGPLEQASGARDRVLKQAHEQCRALEILLKVEVASTLGVTLTFKSTDGD